MPGRHLGDGVADDLHPSASGSMRASASGSRRIVHLVDVRAPGESQSRGRIPAGESQSRGRIPAGESQSRGQTAAVVPGHAGEATMQRAVEAALRGAAIEEAAAQAPAEPELVDPLTSSTSSLTRMRRESSLSTIEAVTGEDDTLAISGLHSRPTRGVIGWVAAAAVAMMVGTAAFAFLTPAAEEPKIEPRDRESEAVVAPTPPTIAPATPEVGASPPDEVEPAEVAAAPEPAPAVAASTRGGKAGRGSKAKSGRDRPARRKRARQPEEVEVEEDDVLEQVRRYMRQKEATEAARAAAAAERPQGALAEP